MDADPEAGKSIRDIANNLVEVWAFPTAYGCLFLLACIWSSIILRCGTGVVFITSSPIERLSSNDIRWPGFSSLYVHVLIIPGIYRSPGDPLPICRHREAKQHRARQVIDLNSIPNAHCEMGTRTKAKVCLGGLVIMPLCVRSI
jgi:hypothetical protein